MTDKKKFTSVEVVRGGEQIILPDGMTWNQAHEWLDRREAEEETFVAINEQISCYPLDGAIALMKALKHRFGWTNLVPTPGFFGATPPVMVGVEVGPTEVVQVPWGRIEIPNVAGYLAPGVAFKDGKPVFLLYGEVKQKNRPTVAEIAQSVREYVLKESIYRGKAIKVDFPPFFNPKTFQPTDHCPKFLDTSLTREEELIFPDDVMRLVKTTVFTPIEKTDLCRANKVPLKRGILLEGPFGTGKTLTAQVTAKKAVENGWTYIYLAKVQQLQAAIQFAQQYSPAVIFAEDVDQVVKGDRTQAMNEIMNTLDGVDTKHGEIMVILTTNNLEDLHQVMLRPGRIDTVIPVRAPDAKAAERLVRLYARDLLPATESLTAVGQGLAGRIPAVIREVVERSKLSAISRLNPGDQLGLTAEDLDAATEGMLMHLQLLEPKAKERPFAAKEFGMEIAKGIVEGAVQVEKTRSGE